MYTPDTRPSLLPFLESVEGAASPLGSGEGGMAAAEALSSTTCSLLKVRSVVSGEADDGEKEKKTEHDNSGADV